MDPAHDRLPGRIHPFALFTLAQIAAHFGLEDEELGDLEVRLQGKERGRVMRSQDVFYRYADIRDAVEAERGMHDRAA